MLKTYSRENYTVSSSERRGAVRDASEDDARGMKGISKNDRERERDAEEEEDSERAEVVPIGRLSRMFGSVQTPTGNNYLDPYIYLHVITLHPRLASSSRDLINM